MDFTSSIAPLTDFLQKTCLSDPPTNPLPPHLPFTINHPNNPNPYITLMPNPNMPYAKQHSSQHHAKMAEAQRCLTAAKISFIKLTDFHLKIGPWSYWPISSKAHRDGARKSYQCKSIDDFIQLLSQRKAQPWHDMTENHDFTLQEIS